jgi:hypothetical protein
MTDTFALDLKTIAHALLPEGLRRWLARILERIGEATAFGAAIIALAVRILR